MADEILRRDQNHITVLGGVTDDANQYVTMLRVDPTTKRLLVSATGLSSGTVTSISQGTGILLSSNPITTTGSVSLATSLQPIATLTGNALKFLRVNAGETAVEYATVSVGITIGTTTITSGTNTRILYNNAGVVGEYTLTGTGTVVAMQTSPVFTTPSLGVATATSINGLTITSSTGTFTLTNAKTLSVTNTLTLSGTDSTTMTFPTTSATIARTDAGQTFTGVQVMTSPSLTSPKVITDIVDTNGNELIIVTATASAVNEWTLANGATGNNPKLTASGSDANVGLDFQAKGTGTYRLLGTSDQAAELRLYEDTDAGTNYTAFKVGTQAGDITYTLPTDDGDSGQVLSTNGSGVLDWIDAGGGGSSVTVMTPLPTQGVNGALGTCVYDTNTKGYTISYDLPFEITVNSIDIRASGAASVNGTVDIGIYAEDGQTKLIDVTSGTISSSAVYHIAVSAVTLPAGRYYVVLVPNGTANVELNKWTIVGVNFGDTGEPILVGTQTVTASTLPATFNPSSDITFSNSDYGPFIRLNA